MLEVVQTQGFEALAMPAVNVSLLLLATDRSREALRPEQSQDVAEVEVVPVEDHDVPRGQSHVLPTE